MLSEHEPILCALKYQNKIQSKVIDELVEAQRSPDRNGGWQQTPRQTTNIQDWQALCKYNN